MTTLKCSALTNSLFVCLSFCSFFHPSVHLPSLSVILCLILNLLPLNKFYGIFTLCNKSIISILSTLFDMDEHWAPLSYYCSNCGIHYDGIKMLSFNKLSPCLSFHLSIVFILLFTCPACLSFCV